MAEHDWTRWADEPTKQLLNNLPNLPVAQFRQGMFDLGERLSEILINELDNANLNGYDICVACSVEDADFLAAGVLKRLENRYPGKVTFACFWNEGTFAPEGIEDLEIAPILKQYREPAQSQNCVLVVVKSVISGACVVATNINSLVSDLRPEKIFVVAPVMLSGAEGRLQQHFPNALVRKFQYLRFAIDRGKDERGWVDPGIGGSVYELYGLGNEQEKNLILPEIVRSRRQRLLAK